MTSFWQDQLVADHRPDTARRGRSAALGLPRLPVPWTACRSWTWRRRRSCCRGAWLRPRRLSPSRASCRAYRCGRCPPLGLECLDGWTRCRAFVEVDDAGRDMVARMDHGPGLEWGAGEPACWPCRLPRRCARRDARLRPRSGCGACFRALCSARRWRSSSSGSASSTRSSSSTAIASCSWKQRARTASHSWTLDLGFLGRLGEITDLGLAAPASPRARRAARNAYAWVLRDRLRRGLHLRPRDLGDPAHLLPDGHGLLDDEAHSDHAAPARRPSGRGARRRPSRRSWRDSR